MAPEEMRKDTLLQKFGTWLDQEHERTLAYHGPAAGPGRQVQEDIWLGAALHTDGAAPREKAVQYCQCQLDVRATGGVECVTTSAVIARNIVRDVLAARRGEPSNPRELTVQKFVDDLDAARLSGWSKRVSTGVPVVGGFMHPVLQLPNALKLLAEGLKAVYQKSFTWVQTSGNTLDNLLDNLLNDRPTLIHGIWNDRRVVNTRTGAVDLDPATLLGGSPHTMPLAMYSADGKWWFYDLAWKPGRPGDGFYKMASEELIAFWGRCYPLATYTKRFTMTTLTIDPE